MDYLKKPIGQLPASWQEPKTAAESDSMVEVATLMENSLTSLYFSQIPLKDSTGDIRHIVTGNGLARWGKSGCPDATAHEYSEEALRFPKETPLGEIMNAVEDFGYVLVTDEQGCVSRIVTYSDVIAELTNTLQANAGTRPDDGTLLSE